MTSNAVPIKNREYTLTVDAIGSEGQGIGRLRLDAQDECESIHAKTEGFAVFVPYALAGECVRVLIIKVQSNYAVGKLLEILVPSPYRVAPRCAVHEKCGGCGLQHLEYGEQLKFKRQTVYDALTRIGGFCNPNVGDTIGMDEPWAYRNKGAFPFGERDGLPVIGMFAAASHRLIPVNDCPIQGRGLMRAVKTCEGWARTAGLSVYNETCGKGVLRHVIARQSPSGDVCVTLVTNGDAQQARGLANALNVASVYHNSNTKRTNAIAGLQYTRLAGAEKLIVNICGLKFAVGPASFLQVNTVQTERLYTLAVNALNPQPHETIADLYCGIGTLSLCLARRCKGVIGIDSVPEAICDARENAKLNGFGNATFLSDTVENTLPSLIERGERFDAIMLDPPRKGCERAVLQAVIDGGAGRLVYVSCNPATLARDLRTLADGGYNLLCATPVDMFPHTPHVETVALLCRG